MFVLGFNHDIGYEFAITQSEHPEISARMLAQTFLINEPTAIVNSNAIFQL